MRKPDTLCQCIVSHIVSPIIKNFSLEQLEQEKTRFICMSRCMQTWDKNQFAYSEWAVCEFRKLLQVSPSNKCTRVPMIHLASCTLLQVNQKCCNIVTLLGLGLACRVLSAIADIMRNTQTRRDSTNCSRFYPSGCQGNLLVRIKSISTVFLAQLLRVFEGMRDTCQRLDKY